jgi:hypothetical protein
MLSLSLSQTHRVVRQPHLWTGLLLGLVLSPTGVIAQPLLTSLPTRTAQLEVSLGAFDDPVLAFSRISGLTVDSEKRLYVLQPMEGAVTVLNPDGSLHRRIGNKGRGPGEFLTPAGVGWRGDTLWVMDASQARVSWFYQGEHVRTGRFVPIPVELGGRIAAQWPMADGSFFGIVTREFEQPAGHPDNHFLIVRAAQGEATGRPVAVLQESFPFRVIVQHSQGTSRLEPVFRDFPLQSTSDSGTRMAIVDRPFETASEASLRLTVVGASGDTIYSHEYRVATVPLTDDEWDAGLRRALARGDRPNRPYGIRELKAWLPRPAHWPSATRVVLGLDHSVWIALAEIPSRAEKEWAVMDENGVPLFRVDLPREFRLFTVARDVLWGVWHDEFDVPHVRRYRLSEGDHR